MILKGINPVYCLHIKQLGNGVAVIVNNQLGESMGILVDKKKLKECVNKLK